MSAGKYTFSEPGHFGVGTVQIPQWEVILSQLHGGLDEAVIDLEEAGNVTVLLRYSASLHEAHRLEGWQTFK